MTKAKLERGNEINHKINSLQGRCENLEKMRGQCGEDMDNGLTASHVYYLQSSELESIRCFSVDISVNVAYWAISKEIDEMSL